MPPPKDGLLPRADLLPAPLADLPPAGLLPPRGVDGCFIMDAGWPSPRGVLPAGGIGRRAGAGRAPLARICFRAVPWVFVFGCYARLFFGDFSRQCAIKAAQNDALRAF